MTYVNMTYHMTYRMTYHHMSSRCRDDIYRGLICHVGHVKDINHFVVMAYRMTYKDKKSVAMTYQMTYQMTYTHDTPPYDISYDISSAFDTALTYTCVWHDI